MTIDDIDRRFGSVAVEKGFITSEELIEAITTQIKENLDGKEHRLIGSILREMGYITIQQIDDVLKEIM